MSINFKRTLTDYYKVAEREYEYSVKVANMHISEDMEFQKKLEAIFDRLDMVSASGFKETPYMTESIDFPTFKNVCVSKGTFTVKYPAPTSAIHNAILESVGPHCVGADLHKRMIVECTNEGYYKNKEEVSEGTAKGEYVLVVSQEVPVDEMEGKYVDEQVEMSKRETLEHFTLKDYVTLRPDQDIATRYKGETE